MSYNFIKKNKSKIFVIIILFFILNLINYFYQINNTKKLFNIKLNLKHNISFEFTEKNSLNDQKKDFEQNVFARDFLERYERVLQLRMQEKTYYELNYDKDLLEISKSCVKFQIKIEGKYFFINCTSSNPDESIELISKNLYKVLINLLKDTELILTNNSLNILGFNKKEIKSNGFDILDKKISYNNNIIKNMLLMNVFLIFIFALYLSYIKKFKKIFYR